MPLPVEMPAPVNTSIRFDPRKSSTSFADSMPPVSPQTGATPDKKEAARTRNYISRKEPQMDTDEHR
jgi:hypothetical protein